MKRIISVITAMLLVFSGFSALAESTFTPAATYDPGERTFNAGEVTTVKTEGGSSGEVTTDVYAGEAGKDHTDEKVYTYNTAMTAMGGGLDWNPHTWETSDVASSWSYTSTRVSMRSWLTPLRTAIQLFRKWPPTSRWM